MPDPCKSCDRKEIIGCRCQAMALTEMLKTQTLPVLFLHFTMKYLMAEEARRAPPEFIYRKYGGGLIHLFNRCSSFD